MVTSCCAYNCKERAVKGGSVGFHRFPMNNERLLRAWCIALRRKDFQPNISTRICSKHFTDDSYIPAYRPGLKFCRLKMNAVPTIFNFEASSRKPYKSRKSTTKKAENEFPLHNPIGTSFESDPSGCETEDGVCEIEDVQTYDYGSEVSEESLEQMKSAIKVKKESSDPEEDDSYEEMVYGFEQELTESSEVIDAGTNSNQEYSNETVCKVVNVRGAPDPIKILQNENDALRQTIHQMSKKIEELGNLTDILEEKGWISDEAAIVLRSSIDMQDFPSVS